MITLKTSYRRASIIYQHYTKGIKGSITLESIKLANRAIRIIQNDLMVDFEKAMSIKREAFQKLITENITNEKDPKKVEKEKKIQDAVKMLNEEIEKGSKKETSIEISKECIEALKNVLALVKVEDLKNASPDGKVAENVSIHDVLSFDEFMEDLENALASDKKG